MKLEITEVTANAGQLQVTISVFFRKKDELEFVRSEEFSRQMVKQYHNKFSSVFNQKVNKITYRDDYFLGLEIRDDVNQMAENIAAALKDIWGMVQDYNPTPIPDEGLRQKMNSILEN